MPPAPYETVAVPDRVAIAFEDFGEMRRRLAPLAPVGNEDFGHAQRHPIKQLRLTASRSGRLAIFLIARPRPLCRSRKREAIFSYADNRFILMQPYSEGEADKAIRSFNLGFVQGRACHIGGARRLRARRMR